MANSRPVHIVALNGSPHRDGNTATLMRWVAEGCAAAGAEVEWLHLVDYDVRHCQGCLGCLRTGVCLIRDDVPALVERLTAADALIVGSPVYAGQPASRLKTFMDRLTLLQLYTRTFEGQLTVGVATSGVAPTRGVARSLAEFFGRNCGVAGATTASVKRGYQPLTGQGKQSGRLRARAGHLGRSLVSRIHQGDRRRLPTLSALWFLALRRWVVRPLVTGHPDQFAGVLRIWREKGWLSPAEDPAGRVSPVLAREL